MSKARDLANLGSNTAALATDAEVSSAVAPKANTADVIANSLVDAKGDIVAASADNTPARVPVGSNNQILIANSSATAGIAWESLSTLLAPATPSITSPTNASTISGVTPVITGSSYVVGASSAAHASSDWQVSTNSGFTGIVFESSASTSNLTSVTAIGLALSTTYYVRVRYRDTAGNVSGWSSTVSFTTSGTAFAGGNQSVSNVAQLASNIISTGNITPSSGGTLTVNGVSLGSYDYAYFNSAQNVTSFSDATFFTATNDRAAFIAVNGDFTVASGQTFIPTARKSFTCIFVRGNATISGTLSMSSRGANLASGNVLIIGSTSIPSAGASGGASTSASGSAGSAGSTGGAGAGGSGSWTAGTGAAGTAFSGGSAGGGSGGSATSSSVGNGVNGAADGGAGGAGGTANLYSDSAGGGGGAGNPGGAAGNRSGTNAGGTSRATSGATGTGGVIILIATGNITISGTIAADGANGGQADIPGPNPAGGGGGSGGGSVNILYRGTLSNTGTIRANGGSGGAGSTATQNGGAGGAGSTRTVVI